MFKITDTQDILTNILYNNQKGTRRAVRGSEKQMKAQTRAKGMQIAVVSDGGYDDYISLTDIAKYKNLDFVMTPKKRVTDIHAIGIVTNQGRYAATYAHKDIAFEFASWISPEFKLYIITDYQRLKDDENSRFSLNCNMNR